MSDVMPKKVQRKRFIAGAVCPSCQAMDRLVISGSGDDEKRECVVCGFSEGMAVVAQAVELDTRVNETKSSNVAEEVQPLNFYPNPD